MNILRMIRLAIAFIVVFTFILIIRWAVLPHLKVFFHGLPPAPLWEGLWNAIIGAGQQLMPFIIAAFLVFYLVYKAIQQTVCRIKLIGKIICRLVDKAPPFAQLKQAGIFSLFDAIFGIIFSRDSLKNRLKRLGRALAAFVESNFAFSVKTADETLGITPMINKINPDISLPTSINLTDKNDPSAKKDYIHPQPDTTPSPVLSDEQREIDDKYQLCVAENTKQITPDMDSNQIKYIQSQNQLEQTRCKVSKFQNSLSLMTNKLM